MNFRFLHAVKTRVILFLISQSFWITIQNSIEWFVLSRVLVRMGVPIKWRLVLDVIHSQFIMQNGGLLD